MKTRSSTRVKVAPTSTVVPHDGATTDETVTRASKRVKTTATNRAKTSVGSTSLLFIPFLTGSSLERVPDDVLREILSHLPTLTEAQALLAHNAYPLPAGISSAFLVRMPTLRALSKTSRLLRSRCLAMAWQSLELCAINPAKHGSSRDSAIGETTEAAVRVLQVCPYLLPLVRTVFVILTQFRSAEIMPALAACLAKMPNLTTLHVMYCDPKMKITINHAFKKKKFRAVTKIALYYSFNHTRNIMKCCPNVKEVTCIKGEASIVVKALLGANNRHVRVLRGIHSQTSDLAPLAELLPNLKHIGVTLGEDLTPLTVFPLLDTIELEIRERWSPIPRTRADEPIKRAIEILKGNKSKGKKAVLLTTWHNSLLHHPKGFLARVFDGEVYPTGEVIKVTPAANGRRKL